MITKKDIELIREVSRYGPRKYFDELKTLADKLEKEIVDSSFKQNKELNKILDDRKSKPKYCECVHSSYQLTVDGYRCLGCGLLAYHKWSNTNPKKIEPLEFKNFSFTMGDVNFETHILRRKINEIITHLNER